MHYDEVNLERRALYGFQHGTTNYKGWFNSLFQPYSLYPYLNLLHEETRDLLYKKTLLGKLAPVFSKHLKISGIANNLLGFDIVKDKGKGVGLIEELANVIFEDIESRKSLEIRIDKVEDNLVRNGRYFSGLSHKIHKKENHKTLKDRQESVDGQVVCVEGILNAIGNVEKFNPALHASYLGSEVNWVISDFPYFSMQPGNPNYDGNVLGLRLDGQVEELLSQSAPFKKELGWYPYVIVSGFFHNSHSPRYPSIKVIDWSWMKFRLPRSFDEIHPFLNLALNDQDSEYNAFLPWIDFDNSLDILLYLSAIHLCYASQGLDFYVARDDIKALAHKAMNELHEDLPEPLAKFYET